MSTPAGYPATRSSDELTGQSLLAGDWRDGDGPKFRAENPRTGHLGAQHYRDVGAGQIGTAAVAAAAAFAAERLNSTFESSALLDAIAERLDDAEEDLLAAADSETGLGLPRLRGELARTTGQLHAFAAAVAAGDLLDPILDVPTDDDPARADLRRVNTPIGPVAVWAASNFPLAFSIAGGDTASALAAGCPVLVKAHPSHPGTSELTARAVLAALTQVDAPPGWFSVLHAHTTGPGIALATHPAVTALAFTGSQTGGRALFDAATRRPIPVPAYAEMGSLNPLIITPGAAADRAEVLAAGLAASVTGGTGQFCTKPGLVLTLPGPGTDRLLRKLQDALLAQPAGVMLNHRLHSAFANQVARTLALPDVRTLLGPPTDPVAGEQQPPLLIQVTSAAFRTHPELAEEHFGPFAVVISCTDADDLTDLLGGLPGSLTATLHSTRAERDLARRIQTAVTAHAGRIVHNGYPTGVPVGWATVHGGPYPATTAPQTTSVGLTAVRRFQRPVAYQDAPDELLPAALQDANPLGLDRLVNGRLTRDPIRRHRS